MKLGLFSDPHYCREDVLCGTRRPRLSLAKIGEALDAFRREDVSLVVCMGDLTDRSASHEEAIVCLSELTALIGKSGLPFRNVPGNHDYLDFTAEELSRAGLRTPPYTEVWDGVRLIVLDANYRSSMRRFDLAGVEWTDSNLPPEQLCFLETTLQMSAEPCVVLIHENLDPAAGEEHTVRNAEEARKIIADSKKVSLVIQGHYHPGMEHEIGGIRYLTLPAMCEGEANRFRILEI